MTPSVEWCNYYWINWKECTGKWSWDNVRYDPGISLEHLTKTTKNRREGRRCRDRFSNRTLSVFSTWPSAKCFRGQIELGNTLGLKWPSLGSWYKWRALPWQPTVQWGRLERGKGSVTGPAYLAQTFSHVASNRSAVSPVVHRHSFSRVCP
jgi:hypothetical protein